MRTMWLRAGHAASGVIERLRKLPRHDRQHYPGTTLTAAATPIWYVTVELRKSGILPRQRSPRETKTFATEADAKTFARSRADEGLAVFAGTINPYSPKRLILSSQIPAWLEEQASHEQPHGSHQE